jgi:glycosyltransferase involved in cell wall biosynthesis
MHVSVIICTYARAEALKTLLSCLTVQTYRNFEVLVVDGSGENASVREAVLAFQAQHGGAIDLTIIQSQKGLTRQRNTGIRHAKGDLLCFLDDDVTFNEHFLARTASVFERSGLQDVGGLAAYDVLNYSSAISMRWRVRRSLRVIPNLEPGSIDRLGRAVPISFLKPFSGLKPIGHLGGFCMIYRRLAISGLWFDEQLPTYGGEDRDFSFRVGQRSRLLICGDLHVKHHHEQQSRDSDVRRTYQDGFGTGRTFAKQSSRSDYPLLLWVFIGDIVVSVLAFARKPSRNRFLFIFARPAGIVAGFRSYSTAELQESHPTTVDARLQDSK